MIDFSILNYPKLIIKSYIYFIKNLELIAIIKFSVVWPILLILSLVNILFLALDHVLFDFKKIEVKNPLFIVGFPRAGTTFLHNIISMDKQFTTPKLWELLFAPSITQKYMFLFLFFLFRPLQGLGKFLNPFSNSEINDLHEIKLNNPEEDYLSFIPYGACFILILFFPVKEIWKLLDFENSFKSASKNRLMRIYKKQVQRHLYFHGTDKIYMTKNPSFTSMSESLNLHFPDCYQIGCHREPHRAIASLISSMDHGYRLMSRSILNDDVVKYVDMFKNYFDILSKQEKQNTNFFLVSMNSLKNQLENSITDIYDTFNYKQSTDFSDELHKQSKQSREYVSKHKYNLSDFNLSADDIKKDFSDYYEAEIK